MFLYFTNVFLSNNTYFEMCYFHTKYFALSYSLDVVSIPSF